MKLNPSVVCHSFSDNSGVLLYDVNTDISVLLNGDTADINFCPINRTIEIADKTVRENLVVKGLCVD